MTEGLLNLADDFTRRVLLRGIQLFPPLMFQKGTFTKQLSEVYFYFYFSFRFRGVAFVGTQCGRTAFPS